MADTPAHSGPTRGGVLVWGIFKGSSTRRSGWTNMVLSQAGSFVFVHYVIAGRGLAMTSKIYRLCIGRLN